MDNKKHLDFITSLVLIALGVYVTLESVGMTIASKKAILASPGLMPGFLGIMLVLCATIMLVNSIKGVGFKNILAQTKQWFGGLVKDPVVKNTFLGVIFIGVYIFVLLNLFSYWLATLIMLVFLFLYLKATSWLKAALISVLTVAAVMGVFVYAFHVPLP
ncbi:MAG: tripartite tricarboxylate transporter TctB family protein [Oscillospiraceae bacterium]|nr:tripartite tricarboxylate transporter TctB family protein [Oscillospiraceae bacterium]